MMSDQDRELLAELGPELLESVIIDGSDLLVRLRAKRALTDRQQEDIKVMTQYTISFNFWGLCLFKADKGRFLLLEFCHAN